MHINQFRAFQITNAILFIISFNVNFDFIKNNYPVDVLEAFNKLIPGAYKADLWRYCVLYKLGGIYLDIKYSCVNNFKLIATEVDNRLNTIDKIKLDNYH